jgi:hypothetical protein
MQRLLTLLAEEGPAALAGGGATGTAPSTVGVKRYERLSKRLLALSARNERYLLVAVVMVMLTYAGCAALAYSERASVATTSPLLGFSALLMWWMVGLWREKASTDLLLVLVAEFPNDVVSRILATSEQALRSNLFQVSTATKLAGLPVTNPAPSLQSDTSTEPTGTAPR